MLKMGLLKARRHWMMVLGLSLTMFLVATGEMQAKVRFGVTGGFQLTNMEFNNDALKESNRVGWFAGPTVKFTLPIVGLGVDVAALYDQRDLKVDGSTFKQESIVVQGAARYSVGMGEALSIFLHAGPQFSFNVGDDFEHWITHEDEYKQFSLQETMLSVNLGLGITLASHFEAAIRYNIPISKTSDFTWNELGNQMAAESWHHAKSRTNAWNVSVSYFF